MFITIKHLNYLLERMSAFYKQKKYKNKSRKQVENLLAKVGNMQ